MEGVRRAENRMDAASSGVLRRPEILDVFSAFQLARLLLASSRVVLNKMPLVREIVGNRRGVENW